MSSDERTPLLADTDSLSLLSVASLAHPTDVIRKPDVVRYPWTLDSFEAGMYFYIGHFFIFFMNFFVWCENAIYGTFHRLMPRKWKAVDY